MLDLELQDQAGGVSRQERSQGLCFPWTLHRRTNRKGSPGRTKLQSPGVPVISWNSGKGGKGVPQTECQGLRVTNGASPGRPSPPEILSSRTQGGPMTDTEF